uniref:Uncharacterized protein n=1 Tax=Arundo donax TaxID=35708 RepID=A0A0A8YFQ2_ARUDO
MPFVNRITVHWQPFPVSYPFLFDQLLKI